jgi:hypothetical protein
VPVIQDDPPWTAEATLPELIEAAVRSDNQQVARSAFAILAERTRTAGTPWALGLRARCQALLDEGSDAEAAYVEAISQLGRSQATVDLARGHLLYGQWLRRAKRRRDARRQLRIAEDMFTPWALGAMTPHCAIIAWSVRIFPVPCTSTPGPSQAVPVAPVAAGCPLQSAATSARRPHLVGRPPCQSAPATTTLLSAAVRRIRETPSPHP